MVTKSLTKEFAIELFHPEAQLPTKGSPEAAGYDLYSVETVSLMPGERQAISIGIKSQIPKGYYGRIAGRSGLALKDGLSVLAGVVDSDYRGVWKVILLNTGKDRTYLSRGSRIAQVILTKIANFSVVEIKDVDITDRGEGGYGSTGL